MVQLDKTLVETEVARIKAFSNPGDNNIVIDATLHTELDDIAIRHLIDYEEEVNYNTNFSEIIYITGLIDKGTYIKRVYPYRDNLEVTLKIKKYGNTYTRRMKLIPLNDDTLIDKNAKLQDEDELNKQDPLTVEFQCADMGVLAVRNKTTKGIFRNTTVEDLIKHAITENTKNIQLNGKKLNYYLNFLKPNNDEVYEHIALTSAVRMVDLVNFLQNKDWGVYNGNSGTFIKNRIVNNNYSKTDYDIYIYSLYNTLKNKEYDKKMIVYSSPTVNNMFVESTYALEPLNDPKVIKVLASDIELENKGDKVLLNDENAFNLANAKGVLNRPSIIESTGVTVDGEANNPNSGIKPMAGNLNFSKRTKPTTNVFKIRSEIMKNNLRTLTFTWNYSYTDILIPGMPVEFVELNTGGDVERYDGILQFYYTHIRVKDMIPSTKVVILLEKEPKE